MNRSLIGGQISVSSHPALGEDWGRRLFPKWRAIALKQVLWGAEDKIKIDFSVFKIDGLNHTNYG